MGREIKRVPLDFDYPIGKVWIGFLNPFYTATKCTHCDGSGYSPQAQNLANQWYGYTSFDPAETGSVPLTVDTPVVRAFAERNVSSSPKYYGTGEHAIVREAKRLIGMWNKMWSHHLEQADVDALIENGRLYDFKRAGIEHPTAAQVNEWSIGGFGHDSINSWVCIKAKCIRLVVPHTCQYCEGSGESWGSNAEKAFADAWEKIEPPIGDGWQLWETVTEGSAVSPVFSTHDELITWMSENGYSIEGARAFVEGGGWSPSFVIENGEIKSGVDAMGEKR